MSFARIAAEEFARRQAKARALVAAGQLEPRLAEQELRPWLAIACRAGAELPELAAQLDEQRQTYPDGRARFSEAELRSLVAEEICPRARWQAALARAADAAVGKAHDADTIERARSLLALSRALQVALPAPRSRQEQLA